MIMLSKYGDYGDKQLNSVKKSIQKSIFFLLLYIDPKTKDDYMDIDIEKAFVDLQNKLYGLNKLFEEPKELVIVMSLLEQALYLIKSGQAESNFMYYRKLILDAGAEVMRMGSDEI